MVIEKHPCEEGITPECYNAYPGFARKALAYKLLHAILPKQGTKLLPRWLASALIAPGVTLPPGLELPPGSVVFPDAAFPPGWTPEDIPPPGYIPPSVAIPLPSDTGVSPPYYVQPWEPGPVKVPGLEEPSSEVEYQLTWQEDIETHRSTAVHTEKQPPTAHKGEHEPGGSDPISTPPLHKARHQKDGADEISLTGLAGLTVTEQPSSWTQVSGKPSTFTPAIHKTDHEDGGGDEISIAGLLGEPSTLVTHKDLTTGIHGVAASTVDSIAARNTAIESHRADAVHAQPQPATVYHTLFFSIPGAQTTGTNKAPSIIMPYGATIQKAYAYARTAPTGAALIFDINKNGTTIWTTQANRLQIAATANSGTQTSFDVTALAENDRLDLDVDQIGSTIAGSDVTVELKVSV